MAFPSTWGGRRVGAGRKRARGRRPSTPHRARPEHAAAHPVHVTLRSVRGAPFLRGQRAFSAIARALGRGSRDRFRVIHFSVQPDHVHLIVEAHDKVALSRGMRGLAIRVARNVNHALGRAGSLWGDRWNGRDLRSPREVRSCLVYVLMNFKKHVRGARGADDRSSASWFNGWRERVFFRGDAELARDPPVRRPQTWLAAHGWRRHGLLSITERPS